jgi:hypothetical protein
MAALDQTYVSQILNACTPTGTGGVPGTTLAALGASAMKLKLTSTASTASASGTEITGTGYTAGGSAFTAASTASSAGSSVTAPATTAISWTNGSGGAWSIVSLEVVDSAAKRVWFGNWNGQPVSVANGNTFTAAVNSITFALS